MYALKHSRQRTPSPSRQWKVCFKLWPLRTWPQGKSGAEERIALIYLHDVQLSKVPRDVRGGVWPTENIGGPPRHGASRECLDRTVDAVARHVVALADARVDGFGTVGHVP